MAESIDLLDDTDFHLYDVTKVVCKKGREVIFKLLYHILSIQVCWNVTIVLIMFDFVFAVKDIPFRTFLLKYLIKAKIPDTQRMCISGQMTRIGGQNYVFPVTGGAPRGQHHFSDIFKNLLAQG